MDRNVEPVQLADSLKTNSTYILTLRCYNSQFSMMLWLLDYNYEQKEYFYYIYIGKVQQREISCIEFNERY